MNVGGRKKESSSYRRKKILPMAAGRVVKKKKYALPEKKRWKEENRLGRCARFGDMLPSDRKKENIRRAIGIDPNQDGEGKKRDRPKKRKEGQT